MIYQAIQRAITVVLLTALSGCATNISEPGRAARAEGMAAYEAGDYQRAINRLRAHVEREPDDIEARYRLGNAHAQVGDLEPALDVYNTVLARRPSHSRARYNRGLVRVRMGAEDLKQARRAGDLDPGSVGRTRLYLKGLIQRLGGTAGATGE